MAKLFIFFSKKSNNNKEGLAIGYITREVLCKAQKIPFMGLVSQFTAENSREGGNNHFTMVTKMPKSNLLNS